ncbi:putative reverse transcriptase zinc-binding domain-containing protein [Senna tora]|uniref:Putative reverse transcriptase zinc-binding domain-containing protein n=1 Tax=Senna tora TaxID=362788 RepID=A0A834WPR4_9FABA|nr:putative reverse transcriptase zinc-binding domain-containing protein [Senna tora]
MDAGVGSNPLLTWMSILAGRKVLERGVSRRIGNGLSTRVFQDNWIPNFSLNEVLNNCVKFCPNLLVFTLISSNGVWNHEAISVFFPPNVANSILSIPLARSPGDDSCFWTLTPSGHYSVKTGAEDETIEHTFLLCNQLRDLWRVLPVPFVNEFDEDIRNEIRLGATLSRGETLKDSILEFWAEVRNLHEGVDRSSSALSPPQVVLFETSKGGSLVLLRRGPSCASVELLEAAAVLVGVEFARDLGCLHLDVEGDGQGVFNLMNGQDSLLVFLKKF